jgi:glycosyltransferase involved in cell wall biosynthesis
MARKDVNIITSLVGKGLEREYLLLKDLLAQHDCYTVGIHYTNWANSTLVRADINIFLEVIHPLAFSLSRENWLFPNSEWWDARNDQFLPRFTKICCKTRDCERIWRAKLANDRPDRVVYTGFEARDLYDPTISRENRFLHLAGESEFKNTEAVIEAWKRTCWEYKPLPITVVTRQPKYKELCSGAPGLTCIGEKIPDDEIKRLMNSHRFHLMPSAYEGFGHALHEAPGCGALVITTAAPPMNEVMGIIPEWAVHSPRETQRSLARLHQVGWVDIQVTCNKVAQACDHRAHEFEARQKTARNAFLSARDNFRKVFLSMVGV